ncbi:MAG TPA: hypothetical protein VG650_01550 [Mycobacteriales bacterium]|nr:hypothetical protein [Mycobacteriales bacterium]
MSSEWALLLLLFAPALIGLVLLMGWLEEVLTQQLVADDVAVAWHSADSPDDLEATVSQILKRVVVDSR